MAACFKNLVLFVVLLIAGTRAQRCTHTNPCSFTGRGGVALRQPMQAISAEGNLSITLTVSVTDFTVDWLTLHRRTFNGDIPGPTWRVKRGDVVSVTLVNSLSLPHKEEALNELRFPNSTNLHTHGLHISSMEPQDNVFVHVQPGNSYSYEYQIDAENPAGTYWYHPHLHGSTIFQVHSGLAGMIIVDDPTTGTAAAPTHLAAVSCPGNCEHDIQLIFQPILQYVNNAGRGFANIQRNIEDSDNFRHNQYTTTGGDSLERWLEENVNEFTTNGQIFPTLALTTGQIKRFRMVNAGGSATLEVTIVDQGTTTVASGCTFKEIAFDGVYLDVARLAIHQKTMIFPSGKADWLMVCDEPGTYEVRSVPDDVDRDSLGDFERHNGLLLTLEVTGASATTTIENTLPTRESFVQDFRGYSQDQVAGRFVVEANPGTRLNRERFSNETDYRFKSELGTVQEWYLTNTDSNLGHPIHIHINHFQVISYNAYTGPVAGGMRGDTVYLAQDGTTCHYQSSSYAAGMNSRLPPNALQYLGHDVRANNGGTGTLGYVLIGEFRDVIVVPPLANITIRFMAHKFIGEVVMHCHILNHEDTGMMMTTEIVNPGTSLAANTLSGNAAPGQCGVCDPFPFNQDTSACRAQQQTVASSLLPSEAADIRSFRNFYTVVVLQIISIVCASIVITTE